MPETIHEANHLSRNQVRQFGFSARLYASEEVVGNIQAGLKLAFGDRLSLRHDPNINNLDLLTQNETARAVYDHGLAIGLGRLGVMAAVEAQMPDVLRQPQAASISGIKISQSQIRPETGNLSLMINPKKQFKGQRAALISIINRTVGPNSWRWYYPGIRLGTLLDMTIADQLTAYLEKPLAVEFSELELCHYSHYRVD